MSTYLQYSNPNNLKVGDTLSVGCKKFTSFAGSLANTNAADTAYADNDVLVELVHDISLPSISTKPRENSY